jgi:hypothetical protein
MPSQEIATIPGSIKRKSVWTRYENDMVTPAGDLGAPDAAAETARSWGCGSFLRKLLPKCELVPRW